VLVDGYAPAKNEQPTADFNEVSPGYFRTLDIPLISGRDFVVADADTSAPVAIVSRAMAQRYWPNASPVGRRLQLGRKWMRVVGVVGDIKYRSLTQAPSMLFYVPLAQKRSTAVDLFLRSPRGQTASLTPAILGAIHAGDPNVSPYEILTLREQVNRSTSSQQITVTLLTLFGGVALLLAAIGLYGMISYMVSQSTRELGVRTALGATPGQLLTLIMSSGLRLTMLGVGLGVVTALGTTRLLGDLLFEVSPRDPLVIGGVVAVIGLAALVASFVPAWRAARIDPMRALRV
jgi:predicted permease